MDKPGFMFFYASKIVWLLLAPTNLLIFIGMIGVGFLFFKFFRVGRLLVAVSILGLFAGAFSPVGSWVLRPLEQRFPQVTNIDPNSFDGIIVLGGSTDVHLTREYGEPAVSERSERLFKLIEFARIYPDKIIAFTGGGGFGHDNPGPISTEADVVQMVLERAGIATDGIIFERKSLNTWQNAVNVRQILNPSANSRWLLVTSAFHIPRSMGIFRQAGFNVIAYPVDFRLGENGTSLLSAETGAWRLARLDLAVREWIGMLAYWVSGRSTEFFPAP